MRKILISLVAASVFIACSIEKKHEPAAVVSGKIENIGDKSVLLVSKTKTDTLQTDSLGNFRLEQKAGLPTFSKLVLGRKSISLYLKDGFDLNLITSKENFIRDTKFEGIGSKENNLLSEKERLAKDLAYYPDIFKLNPEKFIAKSDSVKEVYKKLLKEYSKGPEVDSLFLTSFNADVKYEQFYFYTIYTPYHNYFMKEKLELGEGISNEIDKAIVDTDDFVYSSKFIKFMSEVKKEKYREYLNDEEKNDINIAKYLEWLDGDLNSPKLKNELFYEATKYNITYAGEKERDTLYSIYSKVNTDIEYQKSIDDTYASFEKLRAGKTAVQWSYPDIDGKTHSLSDYKGKLVYIDVWATWCGPCKQEIPSLAKLSKEYEGKDIVFVSVSVDDNRSAWKKMLEKENFEWIQLHAEKAWKSEIIQQNEIRGIPRFMMVDKEGKIISVNAPRPSSEGINAYFDELLSK
ncbi:MAG: TlpA disulfide reductase family protein [Bacteroidota bacterium]